MLFENIGIYRNVKKKIGKYRENIGGYDPCSGETDQDK